MPAGQAPFTAASFYQHLREGRLMGVRCTACGHLSATPRAICRACHSQALAWEELTGRGRLATFTCISVAPSAMVKRGYGRANPYCTGIVALEEGPRVSARIEGVDARRPEGIPLGLPLAVDFASVDPEQPGLVFRPAG